MLKKIIQLTFLFILTGMMASSGNTTNYQNNTDTTNDSRKNKKKNTDDCTETKLEFTGEGLDVKDFKVVFTKINAVTMQSKGKKYPALFIVLANYGKGKRYLRRPKEKGQIQLTMSFNGKTGSKISARKYDASTRGFGQGDNFSANFSSSDRSYRFNKPTGVSEITYYGKDKICGKIEIKNAKGNTILKGTFSVNRK